MMGNKKHPLRNGGLIKHNFCGYISFEVDITDSFLGTSPEVRGFRLPKTLELSPNKTEKKGGSR